MESSKGHSDKEFESEDDPRPAPAGEHIQTVLEAAERTAQAMIREVEVETERYRSATRERVSRELGTRVAEIRSVAEMLLKDGRELQEQLRVLLGVMENAVSDLTARYGDSDKPAQAGQPIGAPAPTAGARARAAQSQGTRPGRRRRFVRPPTGSDLDVSPAMLAALRMRDSGESREEARARLLAAGAEDPDAVLDAIRYDRVR